MSSKSGSHAIEASTKAPRLPSATRRATEGTDLSSLVGNRAMTRAIVREPGVPLPPALRKSMESRFGQDFSSVRVHTDAQAARAKSANAFTIGEEIAFRHGSYRPEQADGQALIAHELAHVVQQRRGGDVPAEGPAVEQDANEAAGAA